MSFFTQPATNLHSPGAIGDVTPGTVGATVFHATGTSALDGVVTCGSSLNTPNGSLGAAPNSGLYLIGAGNFTAPVNGVIVMTNGSNFTDVNRLCWGGLDATYPSFKRSGTVLQTRLADDSVFAPVQGKLTTDTAATTGLIAGALSALTTASIVIYDSTGQAYRVPCVI